MGLSYHTSCNIVPVNKKFPKPFSSSFCIQGSSKTLIHLPFSMATDEDSETNDLTNDSTPTIIITDQSTTTASKDPTKNHLSPFYLYPGEKTLVQFLSCLLLTIITITTSANPCVALLLQKKKLSFINSTLQKTGFLDPNFELWDGENNMVLSWINTTLSPHITQSTICFHSAYEFQDDLQERLIPQGQQFLLL